MTTTWTLYVKLLALFVVLAVMVGFNFARWGLHRHPTSPALYVPGANAERAPVLIQQYGCGACHIVPGVRGATGKVGPRLDHLKEQVYVAGILPNTPQNLTSWIKHPKKANPQTAMPDLDVNEQDARDIADFLY